MNTKTTLPSGAELEIQTAPFDLVMDAIQVIARELVKVEIHIDAATFQDLGDMDIGVLKNAVFQLVGSKEFRGILGQLMQSAMYSGERIGASTWMNEQARGDYFPAAWEVIKHNLAPFFGNLASKLSERAKARSAGPR